MLVVTGGVTARPDSIEALTAAALAHSGRSRAEPECLSHKAYADCEDPLKIFFYEEWADRAALDAHFAQAGSLAFMAEMRTLAASSTRVKILPVADR